MSATDEKPKHVKATALFAPILDEFEIPDKDRLNRELVAAITQWQRDEEGIKRSNVAGWHSSGNIFNRIEAPFVEVCRHFFDACHVTLRRHLSRDRLADKRLNFEGWVNVNGPGAYNQMHTHGRFDLSGVYFVKVPAQARHDSGALEFLNSSLRGGTSELLELILPTKFSVQPVAGKMLLFPAIMPHWVTPNDEAEDRMSIAFNVRLELAAAPEG